MLKKKIISYLSMPISGWFLYCWFLITFFLISLLAYEYAYFKNRAEELCQLRDDYSTYILALKKLIVEHSSIDNNDKKKK